MIWIVLAALGIGILWCSLVWLVLVHEVEIHIMDHCLLFAHMAGARRLYRPEPSTANLMVHCVRFHARSMLDCVHLLLPDSLLLTG